MQMEQREQPDTHQVPGQDTANGIQSAGHDAPVPQKEEEANVDAELEDTISQHNARENHSNGTNENSSQRNETVTFEESAAQNPGNNVVGNEDDEVFMSQDIPIQFEKRTIPKPRTQSVQSVLSSVSLRSLVHQSLQKKQAFVPPQQHSAQPQFIHTKTHIQAPAIAASSKRRASFEIGQRLPFHEEEQEEEGQEREGEGRDDAGNVDSDGETENNPEEQKKLTEDALKKLSSFSKFIPAEVDINMTTKQSHSVDSNEHAPVSGQSDVASTIPILERHGSSSSISPEFPRLNPSRDIRTSVSTPSLARKPSSNPSSASRQRDEQPKLLSNTTSSQNLISQQQQHQLQLQHQLQATTSNKSSSDRSVQEPHKVENMIETTNKSLSPPKKSVDQESLRTISDQKKPMYMPAVLRLSNTNLKPEDLRHINEQNSKRSTNLLSNAATSLRSQTSHWKLSFDSTNKGSPTKAHWRRDLSRSSCALCSKRFTFFERRHHCRHCGDIFCAEHTSNLLRLGNDAQFTIAGSGMLCKVCDGCYRDYETFLKTKFGGDVNINDVSKREDITKGNDRKKSVVDSNLGGNVPADWSWSSF
jgi:hypothetical protein